MLCLVSKLTDFAVSYNFYNFKFFLNTMILR